MPSYTLLSCQPLSAATCRFTRASVAMLQATVANCEAESASLSRMPLVAAPNTLSTACNAANEESSTNASSKQCHVRPSAQSEARLLAMGQLHSAEDSLTVPAKHKCRHQPSTRVRRGD